MLKYSNLGAWEREQVCFRFLTGKWSRDFTQYPRCGIIQRSSEQIFSDVSKAMCHGYAPDAVEVGTELQAMGYQWDEKSDSWPIRYQRVDAHSHIHGRILYPNGTVVLPCDYVTSA